MLNHTYVLAQGYCVNIFEKIGLIIKSEALSQEEFARETGIKYTTLQKYLQGRRASMSSSELEKITTHPRFTKYALWLVTGTTAPESGQISPDIETARLSQMG